MSLRLALAVALVALGSAACAKEDPPPKGASDEPDDPKVTEVRERCADFASRLCASAAPCCESTTGVISVEGCTADLVGDYCENAAQLVKAGLAEYDADSEEPCLAAWARAYQTCVPDWEERLAIRRDVGAACKIVLGTYPPGQSCTTSSQCAQPAGPSVAHCSLHPVTRQRVCQVVEVLGEGADCPFPNGDVSVCDAGLYCTTTQLDVSGVCRPVVPQGGTCDPDVVPNSECGLGNYCGRDDRVCHLAINLGGPACEQHAECVSFVCDPSSTGGSCTDAPPIAADLCERGS